MNKNDTNSFKNNVIESFELKSGALFKISKNKTPELILKLYPKAKEIRSIASADLHGWLGIE